MQPWKRLLSVLRMKPVPDRCCFELDADLHAALLEQARREQRRPDDLAADLIYSALVQRQNSEALQDCWQSLTPREQDVSAYACLGDTNRQIAARMGVSEETVKTHMQNALVKFHLHGKSQLRTVLEHWDFSAWDKKSPA